jgi:hypothetical protein
MNDYTSRNRIEDYSSRCLLVGDASRPEFDGGGVVITLRFFGMEWGGGDRLRI